MIRANVLRIRTCGFFLFAAMVAGCGFAPNRRVPPEPPYGQRPSNQPIKEARFGSAPGGQDVLAGGGLSQPDGLILPPGAGQGPGMSAGGGDAAVTPAGGYR
jgi:hypothetical protein